MIHSNHSRAVRVVPDWKSADTSIFESVALACLPLSKRKL